MASVIDLPADNDIDTWKQLHKKLLEAVLVAREAVAAQKAQKRFWLEELAANLTEDGKLTATSVWKRPSRKILTKKKPKSSKRKRETDGNTKPPKKQKKPKAAKPKKKKQEETPPEIEENPIDAEPEKIDESEEMNSGSEEEDDLEHHHDQQQQPMYLPDYNQMPYAPPSASHRPHHWEAAMRSPYPNYPPPHQHMMPRQHGYPHHHPYYQQPPPPPQHMYHPHGPRTYGSLQDIESDDSDQEQAF